MGWILQCTMVGTDKIKVQIDNFRLLSKAYKSTLYAEYWINQTSEHLHLISGSWKTH